MYSYALLEKGCYYVVQEKEDSGLSLIQVKVVSDHCMFIEKYEEVVKQNWMKKTEVLFDIIELLDDKVADEWNKVYYSNNEDAYHEDEGE